MKKSLASWLVMAALALCAVLVMALKPLGNVGAVLAFFLLIAVLLCGVLRILRGRRSQESTDRQVMMLQKENTLHGKPWR